MVAEVPQFAVKTETGGKATWTINFHRGQQRVMQSTARFVVALGGRQSGKTVTGPHWLSREIQIKGAGDYLVVSPTYPLLSRKVYPEFIRWFQTICKWGSFTGRGGFDSRFLFNDHGCKALWGKVPDEPTQVFFGHAQNADSLESATAKAAWLDEAGQKSFRLASWEAIRGRLAVNRGRCLITSTPYAHNWFKQQLYDRWKAGDTSIEVVRFDSTENPAFSVEEFEELRKTLPPWKFNLFYRAMFDKPAGVIYDCFDDDVNKVPEFPLPDYWPRYGGLDFGGVHTAGVFLAEEQNSKGDKTGRYFVYREYPAEGRWTSASAREHADAIKKGEPMMPKCYGGAGSEDQWRTEFTKAGLPVKEPPIKEVEAGINRVYAMLKTGKLVIMDCCRGLLDEIGSYSRKLDDKDEPTEEIEDKNTYHRLDGLRYICSYLEGGRRELWLA